MRGRVVLLACIGVALVLGAVARSSGGAAPSFARAKTYSVGAHAGAVTLTDLNADGKPDIAVPHFDASTVTVLLNRGDGRFSARTAYSTGAHPAEFWAIDLNGDGKPDVVTANTVSFSVLLNRGDGRFQARRDYSTARLETLVIRELDGNGRPDLVTSSRAGTLSVFLNAGDGSFRPKSDYPTVGPGPVSVGDLNGDGHADLVTASGKDSTLSVFLNRGDGTYESRRDFAIGSAGFSVEIAIADLNEDDRQDIVSANVTSESSSLSVLLNDGRGGFETKRDYAIGPSPEFGAVVLRDLNGDGSLDLLAHPSRFGVAGPEVAVFLNHGDGTFAPRSSYDVTGNGGLPVYLLDVADLSGDGKADLVLDSWGVAAGGGLGLVVRLNRGNGSFGRRRIYRTGEEGGGALADLNDDGRPDLALIGSRDLVSIHGDIVSVMLNRGDGRFRPRLDYLARGAAGIDVADVNGDGRADVVTSGFSVASVLLNRPGLCNVQNVAGLTPAAARQKLFRAGCRVGNIRRVHAGFGKGTVIAQKPRFGAVLRRGGKVSLVVSSGRKR